MTKGATAWITEIYQQELPAITSTASLIEKFSEDETSSLPTLSKSILHDQALASCVLKVANSTSQSEQNEITTISRATVVLGIHMVKNICITAKLLEGLLKNKDLSIEVYQHLTQLMANSFYAGLLAKMMVPELDENTQEEVYLAAMLYRIGETAFWSITSEQAQELITQKNLPEEQFEQVSRQLLGTNFTQLSIALAKKWKLGGLLEQSLDANRNQSKQTQIIRLADKLSSYIATPPGSMHEFNKVLEEISEVTQINARQLRNNINQTRALAINLLDSYGAVILEGAIKPLPTLSDIDKAKKKLEIATLSAEKMQLNTIRQLTMLTRSCQDLNEFLQVSIVNLAPIHQFQRCSFYLPTPDKKALTARFSCNKNGDQEKFSYQINITEHQNIFSTVFAKKTPALINDDKEQRWQTLITPDVRDLLLGGKLCLAPVLINKITIGLIVGQRTSADPVISNDDFANFCFLVDHLNMCISVITQKNK